MRVAAYARVSTQRQTETQTIEQQLDRLRSHAAARGWELAQENTFRDDGHSGASLRRPGLDHLRDAAASAGLDRILITAPDRLARNYVHQVLLVEELQGMAWWSNSSTGRRAATRTTSCYCRSAARWPSMSGL